MKEEYRYKVFTSCASFNHEAFIEDAMNGFVMQQTNFPVVYCIIDDASTDNNAKVIESYIRRHFTFDVADAYEKDEKYGHVIFARHSSNENCWFAVVLLKENHYSQRKSKEPYFINWRNNATYHAICEGDDYWTDPLKLQKQVEILENNPDCTMVCHRTHRYSETKKKMTGEQYCLSKNGWLNPVDVINRGGLYINTCSIIYRLSIRKDYPDYCRKCLVGDHPLQIYCSLKGKVYYFDEIMGVYRVDNPSSFSGKYHGGKDELEARMRFSKSLVSVLKGCATDFPQYSACLLNKVAHQINQWAPYSKYPEDIRRFKDYFKDEIKQYSLFWKIDLFIRTTKIPRIKRWYLKHFLKKFKNTRVIY